MGLGVRGTGSDSSMTNKGVRVEAADKNCRLCRREANIRAVYRRGEDGGIQ